MDGEDGEKEAGRRPGAGLLKPDPGFSFSQAELDGIKPEENTQGSVTSDPTAAYTLVLSLDGWMIPERKGEIKDKIIRTSAVKKLNQRSVSRSF